MAHGPGGGTRGQYTQRRFGRPDSRPDAPGRRHPSAEQTTPPALFLALCAKPHRTANPGSSVAGIFAAPGDSSPTPRQSVTYRPARGRLSLSVHVEPTAAWRELRADLRRAVGESTFEIWLEPLELVAAPRRQAPDRRADGHAGLGDEALRAPPRDHARQVGVRRRRRGRALEPRRRPAERTGKPSRPRGPRPRRRRAEPPLQLRAVHHRRRQPPRPRRGAGGRRASRSGLQPAVPARSARPRQDPPAARHRQLRPRVRRRRPASATRPSRPSPTSSSARSGRARWTASSTPTATPTCC